MLEQGINSIASYSSMIATTRACIFFQCKTQSENGVTVKRKKKKKKM